MIVNHMIWFCLHKIKCIISEFSRCCMNESIWFRYYITGTIIIIRNVRCGVNSSNNTPSTWHGARLSKDGVSITYMFIHFVRMVMYYLFIYNLLILKFTIQWFLLAMRIAMQWVILYRLLHNVMGLFIGYIQYNSFFGQNALQCNVFLCHCVLQRSGFFRKKFRLMLY